MELRQLRYFVAVAEDGNISRAAKRIFLTQPALSRQVKALEEEVGQCLLERQAHSIRLTQAGTMLLNEARELLRQADVLMERVRAAGREVRLRVGYAPSLAGGMLSVAVANFTQVHAGARVELLDVSTAEMLSGLETGKLDLAVGVRPGQVVRGLVWVDLVEAGWQVAVGRQHAWAGKARVTPQDVAGQPLLVYSRKEYPEYWGFLSGWFQGCGLKVQIAGEYDGVDSLLAAVGAGQGVAMVTARTADRVPKCVRLKSLSNPPRFVRIAVGHRASISDDKPLAVFIQELRKAASS